MTESVPLTDWLARYYERGFRLVFYDSKQKGPSGIDAINWTQRNDQYSDYREGQNVGVFTGTEIQPGRFLVDVDFDWGDGLVLAKHILPTTSFGYGRPSRPISHAFYTISAPTPSLVFEGLDNKPIVEMRCTKQDGSIGQQTMLPPSIHPNGEQVSLKMDGEITHTDELPRRICLYAIACLLFSNFANREFVHDVRLATAGFLLSEGMEESEVSLIGEAICIASGNNAADFKTVLRSTAERIKSGERVAGKNHLIRFLVDDGRKIVTRILEWLGSANFIEDSKGRIAPNNQENIVRGLDKLGVNLSFDLFSQKPLITYPEEKYDGQMTDSVLNAIWLQIDTKFGFRPDRTLFNSVVDMVAYKNRFHPVLDYLNTLNWDGVPRIDSWLIESGSAADTEYVREVSSIMLKAAVNRIVNPGCKYDEMVVLESAQQGLMKSTALRTLCPNDQWFSDDLPLNVDAKQIVERTLGKWIIEASDLSGMRPSSVEHLKGMLSRQTDGPVRLAYARIPTEQPRQFIIVGTTNSYSYLTDTTGNRRFWPIRVKQFNIAWIRAHRDLLWAEAFHRVKSGESIRLPPKLYAHATMQQERRRAEDPWETTLEDAFSRGEKWRLSPDEVWAILNIPVERRDTRAQDRVIKIMEHLGFTRKSVRVLTDDGKAKIIRGWHRDPLDGQLTLD